MSKLEKKLQKWLVSKQEVPREEIHSVLDHFFPGMWSYGGKPGSHVYKISHPKLKDNPDYGPDGDMTIPVRGGQKILHVYLKKLIKAIEIITEEEKP
jgi:hypothetical protein